MKSNLIISTWILIFCHGISTALYAGDIKYKVADIPKQLLKDAKAVVRNEEIVVEIKSDEKLVQKVKYAITILNKNGESDANFIHPYDKNMKVSGIKAQIYDEYGAEYKKKGGFDILDYAMISGGTTYADHRIKAIIPEHYEYPFTIEYLYELTFTDVIQFPGWYPVKDFNIAVEKSKYTLIISKQANCRYFEQNIPTKVQVQNTADNNIYTWELLNVAAYADENLCPALQDISPVVLIAPTKINVEGYDGNFETWIGFGQWINQLNQDRNNLTDETKAKIRKLTEGITDDRTKIKILYEYMQNKTRYVSIQVGIGGFQPFDAETVDRLSYGDCKALSNYMKSILEVVGISSRYTLVLAGDEKPTVHTGFPSNQFNHAILCVPMATDTVWLECTSQNSPFNYLGTFTADRYVLVTTPEGGKLVRTPAFTAESDLESRKANVSLNPGGSGIASVKTTYHGATYDSYGGILASDQADRKKMLTRKIHIPNFELEDFTIQETKSESPFVTEKLNLSITSYCTRVGDKLMLTLNFMNKLGDTPFQSTARKNPISIKWPVYEVDTVNYDLPMGYTMEKVPSKVSLNSEFGQYTTEVIKSGSTIQYIRTFKVNKAEYPVERYEEIVAFFEKIVTADENKVMLTKVM
jgi:transglutaminase-like putative cysteine protease